MFSGDVLRQVGAVAQQNGVEEAALLAVCDVESAGIAFWTVGGLKVPPVRPEAHYFYKNLSGTKRAQAVREGLANPRAGAVKVPTNRAAVYARIERMKAIDETAALMSCSWGLGQVMGQWWQSLGYSSVQELVQSCRTVSGQVELMWRFIKTNHLDDEIKRHDWRGFARGYNGPKYAAGGYHTKIAAAYKRYTKFGPPVAKPLRKEIQDPGLVEQQTKLSKLGYANPVTGKEDTHTEKAVKQFQTDQGLVPDGEIGTATREALDNAVKEKDAATGDKLIGAGLGTGTVDATVDKLNESTTSLQWLAGGNDIVTYLLLALTVITVGLIGYGLYKKFAAR